jgi:hypothetical protein
VWQRVGDAVVFTPQPGIPARTRETVMVIAGDGTVRSGQKFSFTTAGYSTLRLQELYSFWREGSANLLGQGAVTGFEGDHGLTTAGVSGPRVRPAVRYIARGSYGSPQSLGCVELPYSAAAAAYPYLPYGTLVTVTP